MTALFASSGLTVGALLLAGLMTFAAAFMRGLTGFGMAIILVPLLAIIMPPEQAVILLIFLQLLIGPVGFRQNLQNCEKPSTYVISIAAIVATPAGLWLLSMTPPALARLLIAAIAAGAFILVLLPKKKHGRPGRMLTISTGVASGILTGFAAMPGPPVVPYYFQNAVTPVAARASMMVIFFATAFAGTCAALLGGMGSMKLALLSLLLLLPMLAGNWAGGLFFGRISPLLWRMAVGLLLGVAGAFALLRLI